MLYLTRKLGEAVIINDDIEIVVVEVKGKTVKLGFNFPSTASVLRKEIYENIRQENINASKSNITEGADKLVAWLNMLHKP